jgi:hypothetical protein
MARIAHPPFRDLGDGDPCGGGSMRRNLHIGISFVHQYDAHLGCWDPVSWENTAMKPSR